MNVHLESDENVIYFCFDKLTVEIRSFLKVRGYLHYYNFFNEAFDNITYTCTFAINSNDPNHTNDLIDLLQKYDYRFHGLWEEVLNQK